MLKPNRVNISVKVGQVHRKNGLCHIKMAMFTIVHGHLLDVDGGSVQAHLQRLLYSEGFSVDWERVINIRKPKTKNNATRRRSN